MPSRLLVPCPELDHAALCQTFLALGLSEDACTVAGIPAGFQCTFSASPLLLLSASTQGGYTDPLDNLLPSDQEDPAGPCGVPWTLDVELPSARLPPLLPYPLDGSASLTEGSRPGEAKGLSSRYKTELCRTFEESGTCKYGAKCQFAHGVGELRGLSRHPKYKTEPCRTFHTSGICPYGARCHFIHNAEEGRLLCRKDPLFRPRLWSGGGFARESLPSAPANLLLPLPFFPGVGLNPNPAPGPVCSHSTTGSGPLAFPSHLWVLQKNLSADSLSDQEDSGSSVGSIGSESPGLGLPGGRRLPIFSQISVSDDWRGYLGEEGGADDDWAGSRGNPPALTAA